MSDKRLDERRRLRTFALAAAVLSTATIVLTWANRPGPIHAPAAVTTTEAVAAPRTVEPHTAPRATSPPRRPTRRLRQTARRFLTSYLPYLYGQAPLRTVEAASRELRQRLARDERRVSPAARRRRPRVRTLRFGALVHDAGAWRVTARVADGDVAVYPIELLLAERGGRLVVVQSGGE